MHFALINWITASLPSHANLCVRLPAPLLFYLFVSRFLFSFPWSFLDLPFSHLSFLSFGALSLSFTHVPCSFFPRLIIILSALHALTALSLPCFHYPFFFYNVIPYVLTYYLLVYCINPERPPNSPSPSNSTRQTWLYSPMGPDRYRRLSEIAHREHIFSSKPIDQRWSDPYLFWNIFSCTVVSSLNYVYTGCSLQTKNRDLSNKCKKIYL